jgi:hypothetical protein
MLYEQFSMSGRSHNDFVLNWLGLTADMTGLPSTRNASAVGHTDCWCWLYSTTMCISVTLPCLIDLQDREPDNVRLSSLERNVSSERIVSNATNCQIADECLICPMSSRSLPYFQKSCLRTTRNGSLHICFCC